MKFGVTVGWVGGKVKAGLIYCNLQSKKEDLLSEEKSLHKEIHDTKVGWFRAPKLERRINYK